jgi:hypothetical protein
LNLDYTLTKVKYLFSQFLIVIENSQQLMTQTIFFSEKIPATEKLLPGLITDRSACSNTSANDRGP